MKRALLASLLTFACGDETEPPGQNVVFENEHPACAYPPGTQPSPVSTMEYAYDADREVMIRVQTNGCTSSSCTTVQTNECSVMLSGMDLIVTSRFEWFTKGGVCTSDCGLPHADCTTPPLAAGTYTIRHGAGTATLMVGSTQTSPCTM